MKNYACDKCGSVDVFIDDRGVQKALCCGDCGAWLKWIGKKEMPLIKRYLEIQGKEIKPAVASIEKSFEEEIYFHREKEDNWDIIDKAEGLGFKKASDLRYLGAELEVRIEVKENMLNKILKINGVDVSDKEIYI